MAKASGAARLQARRLLNSVLATGCPPVREGTVWLDGEPTAGPPDDPNGTGLAVLRPAAM